MCSRITETCLWCRKTMQKAVNINPQILVSAVVVCQVLWLAYKPEVEEHHDAVKQKELQVHLVQLYPADWRHSCCCCFKAAHRGTFTAPASPKTCESQSRAHRESPTTGLPPAVSWALSSLLSSCGTQMFPLKSFHKAAVNFSDRHGDEQTWFWCLHLLHQQNESVSSPSLQTQLQILESLTEPRL